MRSTMARTVFLLMIASATSALAQTAAVCPWLTIGSAATVLGGDVILTAHVEGNFAGSCRFTRQAGETTQSIEVLVGKIDTHTCQQGSTKLKALGNEAVQCRRMISSRAKADTIAGRVRDVYFVVTMTNVPEATREQPADAHPSDSYGASMLERVAEQVAGNLY